MINVFMQYYGTFLVYWYAFVRRIRAIVPPHIRKFVVVSQNGKCHNALLHSMYIPVSAVYAIIDIYPNKRYFLPTTDLYHALGTTDLDSLPINDITTRLDTYIKAAVSKNDAVFAIEINGTDVTECIGGYMNCMSLVKSPMYVFYLYSFIKYGKVVSVENLKVKYINYNLEEVFL